MLFHLSWDLASLSVVQKLGLSVHWLWASIGWLLVLMLGGNILHMAQSSVKQARTLHQIPCTNCQFFTHSYHLKCTVHPAHALTEAAINCPDYQTALARYTLPIPPDYQTQKRQRKRQP